MDNILDYLSLFWEKQGLLLWMALSFLLLPFSGKISKIISLCLFLGSIGLAYFESLIINSVSLFSMLGAITFALIGIYKTQKKFPWYGLGLFIFVMSVFYDIVVHRNDFVIGWQLVDRVCVSFKSAPYNAYLNLDKLWAMWLIGFFYFNVSQETIKKITTYVFLKEIGYAIVIITACLGLLASLTHFVKVDFKNHPLFLFWFIRNCLLVALPQEIVYRGFFFQVWKQFPACEYRYRWLGIVISAILFSFFHTIYSFSVAYLFVVFIVGICFARVYEKSGVLGATAVHALINTIHFIFFSYPHIRGV